MVSRMKCRSCKSTETVLRGFRYNQSGKKQMGLCKDCGKKFTPGKFWKARFTEEQIKTAVKLYSKGLSAAEVKEKMKHKGVKVSRWTIIKWYNKFAGKI